MNTPTRRDIGCAVLLVWGLALVAAQCMAVVKSALAQDAPTVMWVADLNAPAMAVPEEWAENAGAIIACESRWDANAVSATADYGIFQLNKRWQESRVKAMGYEWADVLNPRVNALVAIAIWESWGQSWDAWSCATKLGVR